MCEYNSQIFLKTGTTKKSCDQLTTCSEPHQSCLSRSKYGSVDSKSLFGNSAIIFNMSSKRKSSNVTNFNFRPQTESKKWETKGTRPLPDPVTVQETLLTMVIYVCRRILFFNTKLRVGLYLAGLFLSFIFDVLPFPKSYFSRTDHVFNQYFVKIGWAWTLLLTVPFVFLTSFTYCAGNRKMVLTHLSRLAIATAVWFIITKSFIWIEGKFGKCSRGKDHYKTKPACLADGYFWHSIDISGHVFILIWSILVIIEETRVMNGWEGIRDMIQNEGHSRTTHEVDLSNPMKKLSDCDFIIIRSSYRKFTPYVKALFISMTVLTLIWDMMIISTILYFHIMIEKLIAGLLAAGMWFLTYNYWYAKLKLPPQQPGTGVFKYTKDLDKQKESMARNRFSYKRPSRETPSFTSNQYMGRNQNQDRMAKDDMNLGHEPEPLKKSERSRWDDGLPQSSMGTGVVTRSQTLKSRLDGNKTI